MAEFLNSALRRVQYGWAVSDGFMRCFHTVGCSTMAVLVGVSWAVLPFRPFWIAVKVLYTLLALIACGHAIAMTKPLPPFDADGRCQGGR